jgi:hypothetical protein
VGLSVIESRAAGRAQGLLVVARGNAPRRAQCTALRVNWRPFAAKSAAAALTVRTTRSFTMLTLCTTPRSRIQFPGDYPTLVDAQLVDARGQSAFCS